jgi:hypothetical protein
MASFSWRFAYRRRRGGRNEDSDDQPADGKFFAHIRQDIGRSTRGKEAHSPAKSGIGGPGLAFGCVTALGGFIRSIFDVGSCFSLGSRKSERQCPRKAIAKGACPKLAQPAHPHRSQAIADLVRTEQAARDVSASIEEPSACAARGHSSSCT